MIKIVRFFISIKKAFIRFIYTNKIKLQASKVGRELRVNGPSSVGPNTILGDNVNFNGMRIEGRGNVHIGNNFHSGPECLMITSNHNFDSGNAVPYDSSYIHKDITIEDNVWFGTRVIILGGVTIGEGAIIQAGSVVVNDIPQYGIAGGSPAKVFKYRDSEHYEKLKSEKLFH